MELPEELKIPDDVLASLENPETLRKCIEEGKSLQEIIGYSDDLMEKLYGAAYEVFQEGRYHEAQDGFLFLTTLNPYVYAYWLGLAMSYQLMEEYEQAALAYECASGADPDSPLPYYYLAGCHLYLNAYDEALHAIKILKEKCAHKPEYKELLEKARQAEETIIKRKK